MCVCVPTLHARSGECRLRDSAEEKFEQYFSTEVILIGRRKSFSAPKDFLRLNNNLSAVVFFLLNVFTCL